MITESFGGKGDAKNRITMAIVGFLLAILSVFILQIINPQLLSFDFLKGVVVTPNTQQTPEHTEQCVNSPESVPTCSSTGACSGLLDCKWQTEDNNPNCAEYSGYIAIQDRFCKATKPTETDFRISCCGTIDRFASTFRGPAADGGCTGGVGGGVSIGYRHCLFTTSSSVPRCRDTGDSYNVGDDKFCSGTKTVGELCCVSLIPEKTTP